MATLRFSASPIYVSSVQHPSEHRAPAPAPPSISERHASARLASSLLRQPMKTPQGEALHVVLTNQGLPPSFVSLAASRQLELLAATSSCSTYNIEVHEDGDLELLHRRMVDMKSREHTEAVQEILFALVASKLLHAMRPLPDAHRYTLPRASHQNTTLAMQTSHLDNRLQALHPPDVQPLTSRHVAMVINGANHVDDPVDPYAFALVRTFELGRMYAASVMHGYFLARVYQRFKLEQRLQAEAALVQAHDNVRNATKSEAAVSMEAYIQEEGRIGHLRRLSCPLTLNVIEHHCKAMFGSIPTSLRVKTSDKPAGDTVNVRLSFVRALMYQALAFGSLLWDAENRFVPLFYPHILGED